MTKAVSEIKKDLAQRTVKQAKENFDEAQKNIRTVKKVQQGLLIAIPVIIIVGVPVGFVVVKKLKDLKLQKMQTSESGLLATQYYSKIALAPKPFDWVIPFMSDAKEILALSETTKDFEAVSTAYKTIYNRDFYSDMAKVLDQEQYKTFEANIEKTKNTYNPESNETNADAEAGDLVVTINETKFYTSAEIDRLINLKATLKQGVYKFSVPAKRILKNAGYTGVKKSVSKIIGTDSFLTKENLAEVEFKGGFLKTKKAYFYAKISDLKLSKKDDIKDLDYVSYEIPESYLS